jgi:hypothetical protein
MKNLLCLISSLPLLPECAPHFFLQENDVAPPPSPPFASSQIIDLVLSNQICGGVKITSFDEGILAGLFFTNADIQYMNSTYTMDISAVCCNDDDVCTFLKNNAIRRLYNDVMQAFQAKCTFASHGIMKCSIMSDRINIKRDDLIWV